MKKIIFFPFLIVLAACTSSQLKQSHTEKSALVIGTIHKEHLNEATYPIQYLKIIIENYKPDIIFVEIRPDKLKVGHLEDGPFEMTYITVVAQQMGITVEGIDYWTEEQLQRDLEQRSSLKLDQQFQTEFEKIEKAPKLENVFEYIHSEEKRAEHAKIMNLRKLVYAGNPDWNQRQAWFHYNADKYLRDGKHNRVLAFVGYEHRLELNDFLADIKFKTQDPMKFSPTTHLAELERCVPSEAVKAWSDGSERLFFQLKPLKEPLRGRIKSKAEYFQLAAKKFENIVCK